MWSSIIFRLRCTRSYVSLKFEFFDIATEQTIMFCTFALWYLCNAITSYFFIRGCNWISMIPLSSLFHHAPIMTSEQNLGSCQFQLVLHFLMWQKFLSFSFHDTSVAIVIRQPTCHSRTHFDLINTAGWQPTSFSLQTVIATFALWILLSVSMTTLWRRWDRWELFELSFCYLEQEQSCLKNLDCDLD